MMRNDSPAISIIVPVFNTEKYLADCINSILLQTFKDFELILVDDGSSDSSPRICDKFALIDKRIRVFHKLNGGVSKARNFGIRVALGKYLMFCDSDDIVDEHWCEFLFHLVSNNPNKLVVSGWGRFINTKDIINVIKVDVNAVYKSFYEIYKLRLSGSVCNKIFRLDLVKANNLFFAEDVPLGEDAIFVSEYYLFLLEGCTYVKCPLYLYRQNSDSALHTYNPLAIIYHTKAFYKRALVIEKDYLEDYCNEWLNGMLVLFNNVFDKRNNMNWIQKIALNQKIFGMEEFSYCISHCSTKAESPVIMHFLKLRLYFLLYLRQRLSALIIILRRIIAKV